MSVISTECEYVSDRYMEFKSNEKELVVDFITNKYKELDIGQALRDKLIARNVIYRFTTYEEFKDNRFLLDAIVNVIETSLSINFQIMKSII
jgi:hypothetical protein